VQRLPGRDGGFARGIRCRLLIEVLFVALRKLIESLVIVAVLLGHDLDSQLAEPLPAA